MKIAFHGAARTVTGSTFTYFKSGTKFYWIADCFRVWEGRQMNEYAIWF